MRRVKELDAANESIDMTFYPVTNVTLLNPNGLRRYTPRYKTAETRYIFVSNYL